jgi:hypothetical protein
MDYLAPMRSIENSPLAESRIEISSEDVCKDFKNNWRYLCKQSPYPRRKVTEEDALTVSGLRKSFLIKKGISRTPVVKHKHAPDVNFPSTPKLRVAKMMQYSRHQQ